ncbi:aconitate hydratase [Pseudoroseomonas wenyumeiae]
MTGRVTWRRCRRAGWRALRPAALHRPSRRGGRAEALARMPWCHRILLENVMRQPEAAQRAAGRAALLDWLQTGQSEAEIPFAPSRILMHDTTCGPALVDIAAMRDVLAQAGGDPRRLNPAVPVATSTDHSLPVDVSARPDAVQANMANEMARNAERYRFMKWAAGTVNGFRVFPPGTGIMHTINLERLATVVSTEIRDGEPWAVPDTLVGTDSHTPMVNGIGVLGWGVGGIEAEGVMFDVPVSLRVPEVVGVRLKGALPEGSLATDLALTVTQMLRAAGISGEFVEFFGPGVGRMTAGQRAVVSNMAPEYGATTGIFPIDGMTLRYLRDTGRDAAQVALVESYAKAQGLWHEPSQVPRYTRVLELDLSSIRPSLAGPRRPQDRLAPAVPAALRDAGIHGYAPGKGRIPADAVAIAAVTSCTNTTDLGLLVAAGLVARKARAMGLQVPDWVKTSLTPGSPSAERRLRRAGLLQDLEALGFGIAGYGCATCIGNSGPLLPAVAEAVRQEGLRPVAVLSGNRNFPGRVHAQVDAALLASPPLSWPMPSPGVPRWISARTCWRPRRRGVRSASLTFGHRRRRSRPSPRPPAIRPTSPRLGRRPTVPPPGRRWRRQVPRASPGMPPRPICARRLSSMSGRTARGGSAGGPSPAGAGRRHHHRPHLPGRRDPGPERRRFLADRAGRGPAGPQCLCIPARQLGGDAARPLHQQGRGEPSGGGACARPVGLRADRRCCRYGALPHAMRKPDCRW